MKGRNIIIMLMFILVLGSIMFLASVYSDDSANNGDETTANISEKNETEKAQEEYTDPYSHVRFGDTRDILLLDVEWHTYETYSKVVEELKNAYAENPDIMVFSEGFGYDDWVGVLERWLEDIKEEKYYISRTVNGKDSESISFYLDESEDISEHFTPDGYYIFEIYPYYTQVSYTDKLGEFHQKRFGDETGRVYSRRDYEYVLENEIIPYCDELLASEKITQKMYDAFTTDNPLDRYVNMFFN